MARKAAKKPLGALEFLQSERVPQADVYLLTGSDDFLLEESLRRLRRHLIDSDFADFNHGIVHCSAKTRSAELLDALSELPMLTGRRLLELRAIESLTPAAAQAAAPVLEDLGTGMVVVITAAPPQGRKKATENALLQVASRVGVTIHCQVSEGERPEWVRACAGQLGLKPEPGALEALLSRTGADLRLLHSHLGRLSAYAGPAGKISREDVEQLVPFSAQIQTWRLTAAIRSRDFAEANRILDQLLGHGEQPGPLLSYLNSYLVSLVQTEALRRELGSTAAVARALPRKTEYQVRKTLEEAGTWSSSELEMAFEGLLRADMRIKTGAEQRLVLELLLLQLCSRRGRTRG
ncbi:MAG: DNA polymerase III subunit delta [Armatimonadetes bacterium]|nr:DNA polymerase III subunit delta [Armatimonadota bacterium]